MKKYSLIAFLLAILMLLPFSVFANGNKESAEKDTYIFAADATWPPLEFIDENGNLTGFEVELMPLIGEKVGKTFEVKNIPWDTIFAGLKNGSYDGVSSGVTVTEERKMTMAFSQTILEAGQVIIVEQGSSINGVEDLDGKKVGVQIGTTGDLTLTDNYKQVVVARYDDIGLAIEDMLNGNLDAAVCDSLIASDFVLANENYKDKLAIAGEAFTEEDIAIAVQKDNTYLLDLINEGLDKAKADGSFDALKAKWNLL